MEEAVEKAVEKAVKKAVLQLPRGKPKSGRVWRDPGSRCKSRVAGSFGRRKSWKTIQIERCETKAMKELQRDLREAKQKEKEERRKRIAEKRQKKIENDRKGEVVQTITNVAKLKRLKKKQLRRIEKR